MSLAIGLVILYALVILYYTLNFKETKSLKPLQAKHSFSIIIPFRNEEKHLPQLLKCLEQLDYPPSLFEIFMVDDHSEDQSKLICIAWKAEHSNLNVSILENQNLAKSPKKSALLTALQHVKTEYILTTDADCLIPEQWLSEFDTSLQNNPSDLVAGPVKIIEEANFWTKFQVLDMMSLQVIGLGSFNTSSPLFCNAANLCYNTQTLKAIQAFKNHKDIISGDDVFNLEVFTQQGKKVAAVVHQEATVWTKAEQNFQDLTQQRIRWASKAKFYNNIRLKGLGLLVFLTNLTLVLSLVLLLFFKSFFNYWWLLWLLKLGIDFYALFVGNTFFKTNLCLREYLIMLVVYPFVSSYFAIWALKGTFRWKGRAFKV